MTSVVKITRLFVEARDNQKKFSGTPNNDHVVNFKEELLNVCLQISPKGTNSGNPSGAILEDAHYQVVLSKSTLYDRQVAARANYKPNLKADDPARRSKEENWAASTRNQ